MERDQAIKIIEYLQDKVELQNFQRVGLCRVWSSHAREILQEKFPEINIEVREVDIEPGLSHTFLHIVVNDISYILDGTGLANKTPYFGSEKCAPYYLLESHEDWLNKIK